LALSGAVLVTVKTRKGAVIFTFALSFSSPESRREAYKVAGIVVRMSILAGGDTEGAEMGEFGSIAANSAAVRPK
jgi:hypothetical protein